MSENQPVPLRLADIREGPRENIESVRVDASIVNVLRQVRRTKDPEKHEQLCKGFCEVGQLVPGIAGVFSPEDAQKYLEEISDLWSEPHSLKNYRPVYFEERHGLYYVFLVAGHCRLDAAVDLIKHPEQLPGLSKFDGLFRLELRFGMSVTDAIMLQFYENVSSPPPLQDRVDAAYRFWLYRKKKKPELTPTDFARSIGHSTEWFRGVVKVSNLPIEIQRHLWGEDERGLSIPYGMLVEVARLAEKWPSLHKGKPMPIAEMDDWLMLASAKSWKVEDLAKEINRFIKHRDLEANGQGNMLDSESMEGFFEEEAKAKLTKRIRRIVAPELLKGSMTMTAYIRRMQALLGQNPFLLERDGETFSPGSPAQQMLRFTTLLLDTIPDVVGILEHEPKLRHLIPQIKEKEQSLRTVLSAAAKAEQPALM